MKKITLLLTAIAFTLTTKAQTSTTDPGVEINGVVWATRNVDAPGTFAATPKDPGMFYQWNRNVAWSVANPLISSKRDTVWDVTVPEGTEWEAANDPSPDGWRVPSFDDVQKLRDRDKVDSQWTTQDGIPGEKYTDKATGNSVFFPVPVGWRHFDGTIRYPGAGGAYWTSTPYYATNDDGLYAYYFGFGSVSAFFSANRSTGYNVRSVKSADNVTWNFENGTLTISGKGKMTDYTNSYEMPWYDVRSSISKIIIEEGITHVADFAFYDSQNLTEVSIPYSVTSIGTYAFFNCNSLSDIVIPNDYTAIEQLAFGQTAWLQEQAEGLVYMGKTLYGVKGVPPVDIEIAEGTTVIASYAFAGWSAITSITIPNSIAIVGEAFCASCNGLRKIIVPWEEELELPVFRVNSHWNIPENCVLVVPAGTKGLYEQAEGWKEFNVVDISASNNANLQRLEVRGAELTPAFNADITNYTINAPFSKKYIRGYCTVADDKAIVANNTYYGGFFNFFQHLQTGKNVVSIIVTAEDGITQKTYTISVTHEESASTTTDPGVKINGIVWATRNVDAPGTFVENPNDYGMWYQWGSNVGWVSSSPPTNHNGDTEWENDYETGNIWTKEKDPCPTGWRVPTIAEYESLLTSDNEWTRLNGTGGYRFGSGNDTLFLPQGGVYYYGQGQGGYYWCSTTNADDGKPDDLSFFQNSISTNTGWGREIGLTVRCVSTTVIPKSDNANLTNVFMDASNGGFNIEEFNQNYYAANVPFSTDFVCANPYTEDFKATVSGDLGCKNLSVGSNTFTITVTAEDGITQKTYTVVITRDTLQERAETIHITTPGTLESTLCSNFPVFPKINKLTITGNINACDISFLDSLNIYNLDLHSLDLNKANIVSYEGNTWYGSGFYPENELPDYSFSYMPNLTSIILPETLTSIGNMVLSSTLSSMLNPTGSVINGVLTSLTIPEGVIKIGSGCLIDQHELTILTLPSTLTEIGDNNFLGCNNLSEIINHNPNPVNLDTTCVFTCHNYIEDWVSGCTLYVPYGSGTLYEEAEIWKEFNIIEMPDMSENDVDVVPSDNSALLVWQPNENAEGYKLMIYDDQAHTNLICTIEFDANGRLIDITYKAKSIMQTASANFTYTVENLLNNTKYYYVLETLGTGGAPLDSNSGTFTTTDETTGVVETLHTTSVNITGYYSITGTRLQKEPEHGIYIILYDNGQTEKRIR